MPDRFQELCAKVLAFNNGEAPYNFSGLNDHDRDIAAYDAWQGIRAELQSALADHIADTSNMVEPPADGEVAELVARLGAIGNDYGVTHSADCHRAAELIKYLSDGPVMPPIHLIFPSKPDGKEPASKDVGDDEWDAVVERVWDRYKVIGYQGEEFMYETDFDNAATLLKKELAPLPDCPEAEK